jgi:hypothetical protein
MDLPDVKAGMAIMAEHIQRLNAGIRQVRLRPGIGYFVKESSGGTSLVIPQGPLGGGGGSSLPCPFQCSDVSNDDELKVQVSWGLIYQILPTGMEPDNDPPLQLVVTETCFIYSEIVFNTDTLMPTQVNFSAKTEVTPNSSTTQYNLIAVVTVDEDAEPKVIKNINNICQQPYPNPCALASQ